MHSMMSQQLRQLDAGSCSPVAATATTAPRPAAPCRTLAQACRRTSSSTLGFRAVNWAFFTSSTRFRVLAAKQAISWDENTARQQSHGNTGLTSRLRHAD
jgi:hypothetical protein